MIPKEIAILKKQLLDSKSQTANFQAEVERLTKRTVELESALILQTEANKALQTTRDTHKHEFAVEREKLVAEADKRLAEATAKIRSLQENEVSLNAVNERAQRTIDALRSQIAEYQSKFTQALSSDKQFDGVDIQEIFNHEFREKERLNQLILEQTRHINELQTTKEGLLQENRKFREEFGIPANFAHITLDNATVNHLTRIEYLEREVEGLEEERAELRCKLRQLAAMVNPKEWDGDVFANLNLEQKELVCLYAINLLNGKNEVYLTDKSKELARENDALKVENEVLKRNLEGQQKMMAELAQGLKHLGLKSTKQTPKKAENHNAENELSEIDSDCEPEPKDQLNTQDQHIDLTDEQKREIEERKVIDQLTQSWLQKDKAMKVSWKYQTKDSSKNDAFVNRFCERLLRELQLENDDFVPLSPEQNMEQSMTASHVKNVSSVANAVTFQDTVIMQMKLLKTKLNQQERLTNFNEQQAANLQHLIDETVLGQTQHFALLKENALNHRDNIKLRYENEALQAKLELEFARASALTTELEKAINLDKTKRFEADSQLRTAVQTITNLNAKLSESVSLSEHQTALQELTKSRQSVVELSNELGALVQLKPRYERLLVDHGLLVETLRKSQLNEVNLTCELQVKEELLCQLDQGYLYFKNLIRRMADLLKLDSLMQNSSLMNRIDKVPNQALTQTHLNDIMKPQGMTITQADWELLKTYLLTDATGAVLKSDFVRKVKLEIGGLMGDENNHQLQTILKSLIDKTQFDSEALFGLFDSDSDGFITCDDVTNALRSLSLAESCSVREKLLLDASFFSVSKRLDQAHFVAVFRTLLGQGQLEGQAAFGTGEAAKELEFAKELNSYLKSPTGLNNDVKRLFSLIDCDRKGGFSYKDFEMFLLSKLKLKIDKYAIERLFSMIAKDGISQVVNPLNFERFLTQIDSLSITQERIDEMKRSAVNQPKFITKPFNMTVDRAKSEGELRARTSLVSNEKQTVEFSLNQQKLIVAQLNEQVGFLNQEIGEKEKLLRLYKQEVSRLCELLDTKRVAGQQTDSNPTQIAETKGQIENKEHADCALETERIALQRLQEIQSLKLKLTLAEQEKLDTFKSAAAVAAQHGVSLKNFAVSFDSRSREILLLNAVREKEDQILSLTHKNDHLQAKWVQEKMNGQRFIESLCDKLQMLQSELARQESGKLLIFDVGKLEQLSAQNRELTNRLTASESQRAENLRFATKAECDLDQLKVNFQYFVRRANITETCVTTGKETSPKDGLLKRFEALLEEAKVNELERIKAEKELKLEKAERKVADLKSEQREQLAKEFEMEVEKLAAQNHKREQFWSLNYQKLLSVNSKISTELNDYETRKKEMMLGHLGPAERQENLKQTGLGLSYINAPADLKTNNVTGPDSQQQVLQVNTINGITAEQLKELIDKINEPSHSKALLEGAQSTMIMLENLLNEKQTDIERLNTLLQGIRSENANLRDKLIDFQIDNKENIENRSQVPSTSRSQVASKASPRPDATEPFDAHSGKNHDRKVEKQLRIELETLKQTEQQMTQEVAQLKVINQELMEKLKLHIDSEEKLQSEQAERVKIEQALSTSEQESKSLKEKLKKKESEVHGLLQTIKTLKNDLVGQTQTLSAQKPIISQSDEKVKQELEGKLKVTQIRLKEATQKLKATAEELESNKAILAKKESELPKTNSEFTRTRKLQLAKRGVSAKKA